MSTSSAADFVSSRVPSLASSLASGLVSTARMQAQTQMQMHPVLHRTAQPVSVSEFTNALREAAPPRFPHVRVNHSLRVYMAISGGVDSMALAYLCARAYVTMPWLKVSDAGCGGFKGLVVDHGLRENSTAEAQAVCRVLQGMGHKAEVLPLRDDEGELFPFGPSGTHNRVRDPSMETLARRWRYRTLGRAMRFGRVSLLLAHHEDDQYETVLMRLLSGAGVRGLRGMRAASDLPECHDIHGAYQSGYLDDKYAPSPKFGTRPTSTQKEDILREFRREESERALMLTLDELDDDTWPSTNTDTNRNRNTHSNGRGYRPDYWEELTYMYQVLGRSAPILPTIETEDLGVMVYRPLLPFPKERLIATCLANNVPWFEDHTNADPTLTTRNALRHVAKNHTLPQALQKPAILRLSARCDAACRQHEAEARRLILKHRIVVQFNANVGTVVARLPRLLPKTRRRRCRGNRQERDFYTAMSVEKRRLYLRNVAGLVVQKLLSYVTPETNVTPVSQLQTVIDTLFPDLVDPKSTKAKGEKAEKPSADPSAFVICGVHFMPFGDGKDKPGPVSETGPDSEPKKETGPEPASQSWYLVRAPYISPENALGRGVPHVPSIRFPSLGISGRRTVLTHRWDWSKWSEWNLYDGRFWMRIRTRLPVQVVVQPFDKDYSKEFREALAKDTPGPSPYYPGSSMSSWSSSSSSSSSRNSLRLSRFLATLKTYAPGKVRYTLPAIYATADVSWALEGRPYWPEESAKIHYKKDPNNPRRHVDADLNTKFARDDNYDPDDDFANNFDGLTAPVYRNTGKRLYDMSTWDRHMRIWERKKREALYEASSNRVRPTGIVLALPTIDASVPGIENWLKWEVRYRKVDKGILDSIEQDVLAERMYAYESQRMQ